MMLRHVFANRTNFAIKKLIRLLSQLNQFLLAKRTYKFRHIFEF